MMEVKTASKDCHEPNKTGDTNENFFANIVAHILTAFLTIFVNRRKEKHQDRKLYVCLMIGGFVWSQLQTEYLIWRINKKDRAGL
jgi:hypothetical protein